MELPIELSKASPRDIDFNHAFFAKTQKRIKSIFVGAFFIIPLMALIFLWKFNDIVSGLIWGAALTAFFELFAVALLVNVKKSVELFRSGIATMGTVEKMDAPADKNGNAYFVMKVSYSDKFGITYSGNVATIGKASELDKKNGDQIIILYLEKAPQTFAIYTPGIGITMSKSKAA